MQFLRLVVAPLKRLLAFLLLWPALAFGQAVTPPGTAALVCAFNTSPPAITSGLFAYVQCDSAGKLLTSGGGGSGTVTSVAETFTGGLISVAGSPITTSGTFALTVAGTSGGIPYFASSSTWASSAALTANALIIGGGAGAAPATTTTGSGVLIALGQTLNGSGAISATTSPTFVTPALGVATATSLAVGGATLGTSSLAVPAGSAAAPSLVIGNSTTGLYSVSTVGFGVTVSGISVLDYGTTGGNGILTLGVGSGNQVGVFPVIGWGKSLRLDAGMSLAWNSGAIASGADTGFIRFAAATIHMGNFDAASIVAQTLGVQSIVAGTSNTAGQTFTVIGSLSTGSGASGDIAIQTGGTGAGATVQNTATTAILIKGATQNVRLPQITSDAALTDTTVCQDTTNHALFLGSGTLGICLGTSSVRYKHDVSDLGVGLHAIMGLQPKRYFLDAQHGDPKKPYYGFLAEDGVSVLPELVGNDNFGRPNTFDYLGIVPILVRAVQEQQNEIQILRRAIR